MELDLTCGPNRHLCPCRYLDLVASLKGGTAVRPSIIQVIEALRRIGVLWTELFLPFVIGRILIVVTGVATIGYCV